LPNGRIKEYYDRENPVVCCPWHGWEYDVKTGRCVGDPERHLRVYETALEDNKIVIVT
jgi:nitrite reductase/ring-hydroxylating ferredoxin subunit